jgi:hypothetical protein
VAELWEDHGRFPGDEEGVVLAEAGALAAVVAPFLKDSRDEQFNGKYIIYLGLQ